MKKKIKTLIPIEVRNFILRFKNTKALKNVPYLSCDISSLRFTPQEELCKIFTDDVIIEIWDKAQCKMNELQLPNMAGGINPGDQRAIFYMIRYFNPKNILEIGTHIGCSTVNIGLAFKDLQYSNLVTVDILDVNDNRLKNWLKYGSKFSPKELISQISLDSRVKFVQMNSVDFLKKSKDKFDFIFLDGSHLAEKVYQEIPEALKLLGKNGVILLHDYFPDNKPLWKDKTLISGPFMAINRILSENGNICIQPLGNLPWNTKLDSNRTSLALLSKKK